MDTKFDRVLTSGSSLSMQMLKLSQTSCSSNKEFEKNVFAIIAVVYIKMTLKIHFTKIFSKFIKMSLPKKNLESTQFWLLDGLYEKFYMG